MQDYKSAAVWSFIISFSLISYAFFKTNTGYSTLLKIIIALLLSMFISLIMILQTKVVNRKNADYRNNFWIDQSEYRVATRAVYNQVEGALVEGHVKIYGYGIRRDWRGRESRAMLFIKKLGDDSYEIKKPELVYVAAMDCRNEKSVFHSIKFLDSTIVRINDQGRLGDIVEDYKTSDGVCGYWVG